MTREEIQKEIEIMDAYIPVYKIEEKLGMPPTTLQKVLSGKRELPRKWLKVLEAYFVKKPQATTGAKNDRKEEAKTTAKNENGNRSKIEQIIWEAEQEILKQNKK